MNVSLFNYQTYVIAAQKNLNLLSITQAALLNGAFILFFATILTSLSYGTITVFTTITLFTYWLQFTQPIEQLALCYNQLLVVSQDVKGLFTLLDIQQQPKIPTYSHINNLHGTITFNNVSYHYAYNQF